MVINVTIRTTMCGIVGYIGKKQALPILMKGIKNLEYRGYDSAGVAVVEHLGPMLSEKAVGRIAALEQKLEGVKSDGGLGIVHTRWATHGGVTYANAHPHHDCESNIWIAHNGIVENYQELRDALKEEGHKFYSQTDTEVIAHLIEDGVEHLPLVDAVRNALSKIKGTYGLVVIDRRNPNLLIAARFFSPLLLGIAKDGYLVASDASAVLEETNKVVYLDDGEIAVIESDHFEIIDFESNHKEKQENEIEWSQEQLQKSGYEHFMLKEIMEGPDAVIASSRGRLVLEEGGVKLGGLAEVRDKLKEVKRMILVGCGTSYHAALIGKYILEEHAGIPTTVELASEFRYRKPLFQAGDAVLAISQSGETADTLAAIKEAKKHNILTLGIVNVVGSSIARETDAGVYQHIGPEIGVASTKAFLSQVIILALFALHMRPDKKLVRALSEIPALERLILKKQKQIQRLAARYQQFNNFLFLGRGYNFPTALEGALKLKEISYVHAEGMSAGEMKHGPIAMIEKRFPSVVIVPQDAVYEKTLSNIEEIKARGGPVIAIATEGDTRIAKIADDVIYIPKTIDQLTPLLSVIPLQLFAYYFGVGRGYDVDKPRNLAKSVTVE